LEAGGPSPCLSRTGSRLGRKRGRRFPKIMIRLWWRLVWSPDLSRSAAPIGRTSDPSRLATPIGGTIRVALVCPPTSAGITWRHLVRSPSARSAGASTGQTAPAALRGPPSSQAWCRKELQGARAQSHCQVLCHAICSAGHEAKSLLFAAGARKRLLADREWAAV